MKLKDKYTIPHKNSAYTKLYYYLLAIYTEYYNFDWSYSVKNDIQCIRNIVDITTYLWDKNSNYIYNDDIDNIEFDDNFLNYVGKLFILKHIE